MQHEAALKLREACLAAGLAFSLSIAMAEQQQATLYVDLDDATLTVVANEVPLKDLLEEIALRAGLIVYSRESLDEPVTMSVDRVPLPDVLRRLLRNCDYTLHYVFDATREQPVFGSRLWILGDETPSMMPASPVAGEPREMSLRYAAGDPERIRLRAISSLETWEAGSDIGADLRAALRDPAVAVREEAVNVLGELDWPAARPVLQDALDDPAARVRLAAISVLGDSGRDEAAIVLGGLFDDPDRAVREAVIHAMADIGTPLAYEYLRQALADGDATNREMAAGYLAETVSRMTASRF